MNTQLEQANVTEPSPETPPSGFYIVEQFGQRTLHPLVNGKPLPSHVFATKDKINSAGEQLPSHTTIRL